MAKIYYPTCQARFQLRLDEGPDVDSLKSTLERQPGNGTFGVTLPATEEGLQAAEATNRANRDVLGQSRSVIPPNELQRQQSQLSTEGRDLQGARFGGQANTVDKPRAAKDIVDDDKRLIFASLPITASVERTSIKEPDTAEVTFDYKDLPIDPRSIRAGLVTLTIGGVTGEEYQRGIVSREERTADGMLVSIIERREDEELRFSGTASRFVGFIDEWNINLSDDGDTVTLKMRDITALFIDEKMQPGITIDLSKPLDQGVRDFINIFPSMRDMQVFFGTPEQFEQQEFNPSPPQAPIPKDSLPETSLSRGGQQAKAQKKGDTEDNVWDHIVVTAAKLGLTVFVRGFVLFIVEARALFDQVSTSRKMVYGRNIRNLEFARKLGGVTTQTIEVRSYDPDIGRARWARFPVEDNEPSSGILGDPTSPQPVTSRAQKVAPGGQSNEQVQVVRVARVTDNSVLENIAENYFQEMARQEIEGSFTTDDLDSFKETLEDEQRFPEEDLLNLYPGDPVTLLTAPPDTTAQGNPFQQTPKEGKTAVSNAQELTAMTFGRRSEYLQGLGMSPQAAERLAAAAEAIPLANTFRVGTFNLDFDVEDGVTVECSFYNFITIRELGRPDDAGIAEPQAPQNLTSVAEEATSL